MNKKLFVMSLLSGIILIVTKTQAQGYVQDEVIKVQGITTDAQIYPLSPAQKQTTHSYYDGLGRTLQTVALEASPLQHDVVQPVAYDNLGRQTTSYLPYADENASNATGSYRPNAISTDQAAFYNNTSQYLVENDSAPYSQQVFENSPLQRLLQEGMVGSGFQPGIANNHYKNINYRFNLSTDGNILQWNPNGTYTIGNYYAVNKLSVTDGKDEDNAETLTFTDLTGHTILKRQILSGVNLDTYYIYNNAGMISYIIPPAATNLLSANSYNLTIAPLSNMVFNFVYDNIRGRMIQKTVPAKGTMSIVYDPLSRPVLMQDANMATKNQWNYIKYDAKGRKVSQGIYTDNITSPVSHIGQANMQAYVNTISYATTWCETRTGSATQINNGYYTNNVFPTGTVTGTTLSPLAYAYFDDYALNNTTGTVNYSYISQNDPNLPNEEIAATASLKGMPTVISKTTVGAGLTNTWLTTAVFYDHRLNPIQQQSNNQLYHPSNTVLNDVKTTVPDFMGVPQAAKVVKQTAASTSVTVYTYLSYDPMDRITSVAQRYNTGSQQTVAAYQYNELGQVIKKGLGYATASTYLQNLDMRYNIRGQLLYINNSKLISDGGVTNSDGNDVFGMQMLYNGTDSNLGNTGLYNGKLSAVKWMTKDGGGNPDNERAFVFSYDAQNRYTGEAYSERATSSTSAFTLTHGWDETAITYDANGNIITLNRNSSVQNFGTVTPIDQLKYTYAVSTSPNQLQSVADNSGSSQGFVGGSGTYLYDPNGNLTNEPYKGISQISYDVLNRTDIMTFASSANRYITYTYDAGGALIRKMQYDNMGGVATLQSTTDYIDGFVYITPGTGAAALSYFPMPEGRVLYNSGTFTQEFIITDPQGNARVSFQNNGSGVAVVKQETSYYGFGEQMPGSLVNLPSTPNRQLYNGGSEWQNDYGNLPDYDQTFYRNYDAALGRWIGVDPEAESVESMSSYQYAGNNPIMMNDPMGNYALPKVAPGTPAPMQFGGNDGGYDGDGGGTGPSWGNSTYVDEKEGNKESYDALIARVLAGDPLAISQYAAQTNGNTINVNSTGSAAGYSQLFAVYAGYNLIFGVNGNLLSMTPNNSGGIVSATQLPDEGTDAATPLDAGPGSNLIAVMIQNLPTLMDATDPGANQGAASGGLALIGVPTSSSLEPTFLGKTYGEWYDAASKALATESAASIATTFARDIKVARIGTGVSVGIAATGFVLDLNAALDGKISWFHFGVNQGMSYVGLAEGLPGAIISGAYFGFDAFYGFGRLGNDISHSYDHSNDPPQGVQGVEDDPAYQH